MMNNLLNIYPRNYIEVNKPFVFFFIEKIKETDVMLACEALQNSKIWTITSSKRSISSDERTYFLYVSDLVIKVVPFSQRLNFQVINIYTGSKAKEKKDKLYKTRTFMIVHSGIKAVHNKKMILDLGGGSDFDSWQMDAATFEKTVSEMENYFDEEIEEKNKTKKRIVINERFRKNILTPFRNYTNKENWVELYKQTQAEGIDYYQRVYSGSTTRGPMYSFYSHDNNANPEEGFWRIGDRVSIVAYDSQIDTVFSGFIDNIDNESTDAIIITISFYRQFNDNELPVNGRIIVAINETQTKVRTKVIKAIERTAIQSQYMYKTFSSYEDEGYTESPEDLKEYLKNKLKEKYPPNQMQLEAIIKGILSKDLLLVLGPPGTGKTTVISFWVEYFISHGKRILISSQNNAAVDNVLERFGELAETVRLGNDENKVQENCKQYLLQNKISAMKTHFDSNYKSNVFNIEKDKESILLYKEKLLLYGHKYSWYKYWKTELDKFFKSISKRIQNVLSYYESINNTRNSLEAILEKQAHQAIFLRCYYKKPFYIRVLRRNAVKRVQQELNMQKPLLDKTRKQLEELAGLYNREVQYTKDVLQELRQNQVYTKYLKAKEDLFTFTKEVVLQKGFQPSFQSPLQTLYKPLKFVHNIEQNEIIREKEKRQMDAFDGNNGTIVKMEKALTAWNCQVQSERNDILQNALIESSQIVGATCIGINSNSSFAKVDFDVAIIDESGQIQIHNVLVPMSRARKNLLLGDYKQIPPNADEAVIEACESDEIDTSLYKMSFFEFLFEKLKLKEGKKLEKQGRDKKEYLKPILPDYQPKPFEGYSVNQIQNMISLVVKDSKKIVNLNRQFRMPEDISKIISEWFYENNYYSSYDMEGFRALVPETTRPLVVVSTSETADRWERQPESKMGYFNKCEAKIIADMVEKMIEQQSAEQRISFCETIENTIGIISAYGAQVRLIREYLEKKQLGITPEQIKSMVASLDSFQGQERPVIFYSLTRSTSYKDKDRSRVGFMKELRRLNVAFTRCKQQLIIVGDMEYLSSCLNIGSQIENNQKWPCEGENERQIVDSVYINQCSECTAICERRFARFIRLLMQHVFDGGGELFYYCDNQLRKEI